MPQRNISVLFLAAVISLFCYLKANYSRYASVISEAMGQIRERYIEPVERRALYEGAMSGMVQRLDQYSAFITEESLRRLQENIINQQFGGVGIEVVMDDENQLTVLSPILNTPAFQAGIQPGDVILSIDGQSTEGISLEQAVDLMRGEVDTVVSLSVLHLGAEQPSSISIRRAVIKGQTVLGDRRGDDNQWSYVLAEEPRIGYIRITSFADKTSTEMRRALESVMGSVGGIIIDLRGNAGGLLTAAVEICDYFIDEGLIVSTRDRFGHIKKESTYRASRTATIVPADLPVAILVNQYSASASEIMAACLQDHDRATIVGQRTWGKGTVQNVILLEGGRSAIKLTTANYWRPSMTNIHRSSTATEEDDWGVVPDDGYNLPITDEEFFSLNRSRRVRELEMVRSRAAQDDGRTSSESSEFPPDKQLQLAIGYIRAQMQGQLDTKLPRAA